MEFGIALFFVKYLAYYDSRLYMKYYNKMLQRAGVNLKGKPRFISMSTHFDDFEKITLGDRITISSKVFLLTHDYSLTTALIAYGKPPKTDTATIRSIKVGNNVFIGMNCILLPGTTIGNNVIVGAGSIVKGNIPDYSVVSGNPAVLISDIRVYAEKILNRGDELKQDKN